MKKALVALFAVACVAYGFAGVSSAEQSTKSVQKSLDRMSAVEASLN